MKRKYYMRGLGLGIVITAVLCAVALPKKTEPMTDEEIIARAEALGYVKDESGVSPEDIDKIKEKASGTPGVSDTPDATDAPDMTGEPEGTPGPTHSPVPTPDAPEPPDEPDKPEVPTTPSPKPTATSAPKATATPKPTVTVTVKRGATARRVAEQLEEAGAVEDSEAFVKYLQSRKLTDFINIGTFMIPQEASHAEIARILTGK